VFAQHTKAYPHGLPRVSIFFRIELQLLHRRWTKSVTYIKQLLNLSTERFSTHVFTYMTICFDNENDTAQTCWSITFLRRRCCHRGGFNPTRGDGHSTRY